MSNEVASITVLVQYRKENEMISEVVPFRVYQQDRVFIAVSFLNASARKYNGVPETISFRFDNNQAIPITGDHPTLLNNIVKELKLQDVV